MDTTTKQNAVIFFLPFFNIQTWILFIFGLAPQIRALQGFSYLPEIWRVSSL
jgi:hypothetical protein